MDTDDVQPKKQPRGCLFWLKLLAIFIMALVCSCNFIFPAILACRLANQRGPDCCDGTDPAQWGLDVEEITLTTSDNITIAGWYQPSQNKAGIILVHGSLGNRTATVDHAAFLAAQGYGVLMIDLRGHGKSGGEHFTWGWDTTPDIEAAAEFLAERPEIDPARIGAMGLSMGGEVVLQAAAYSDKISAVVSDGAGMRTFGDLMDVPGAGKWLQAGFLWTQFTFHGICAGVEPPEALADLTSHIAPRPVFLISNEKGFAGERLLTQTLAQTGGATTISWEVPGSGHIGGLRAYPDEYQAKVLAFFDATLPGEPR